jgi:FkbM family methyltransferase
MLRLVRPALQSVLRRIGRRWPDQRLLDEIEFLQARIESLRLLKNPAEPDGEFVVSMPGTPKERRLYRSGFSMTWIEELKIDPTVIFDVGSYDGGDSIRFKQRFPRARVIAFEADPDRSRAVGYNVTQFGIEVVNRAVCDRDGPVTWYQSRDDRFIGEVGSQGSIYRHRPEYERRYSFVRQVASPLMVAGTRVDSFCRGADITDIDIAQIDVEGAEYDVIVGFGAILPKLIYIESAPVAGWLGARQVRDVHRLLTCVGYVLAADFSNDRLYVRADLVGRLCGGSELKVRD